MNIDNSSIYRCPSSGELLTLVINRQEGEEVLEGQLTSVKHTFPILDGVPDFRWPLELANSDRETLESYEAIADDYDRFATLPFQTYLADEDSVRNRMIDQLNIGPDSKVLEIGCGTGRGSQLIAQRLSASGRLFLQEISPRLLKHAVRKLTDEVVPIEFSLANGSYLPFPENSFDAAHHWGGINTFAEVKRCLAELSRVVRPGGKVVVGDESLGPWLRETQFGKVMMNSNPLLKCEIPVSLLPTSARDVRIEWIMMNAFWVLEFQVGDGEPQPNYHLQIPSARGGSHWSRYYGQLEGVSDVTKRIAQEAQRASGLSMHQWLDAVVSKAAQAELQK